MSGTQKRQWPSRSPAGRAVIGPVIGQHKFDTARDGNLAWGSDSSHLERHTGRIEALTA